MNDLDGLTDDQLTEQICTWAARVAAGEAHLLTLIAELDRREAWAGAGMLSCAHWLSWRAGLGLGAARERVRVARVLPDRPDVQAAFHAGRMTWSQVRAVTRVAEPDDGIDWVELAEHSSAAQLERLTRGIRRAQRLEEDAADPEAAQHRMRTRTRYDDDGTMVITIRASAEDGAVILAGLEAQRAALDKAAASADVPAGTPPPPPGDPAPQEAASATVTEALLELTRSALDQQRATRPLLARRTRSPLVAHVDPLSGWARLRDGELLPPSSLRAALRSLPGRSGRPDAVRPLSAADVTRHDSGRRTREVSQPLRDLLGAVDGERCRFPACTRRHRLHAHHLRYWSQGGRTDLANLLLLCSRHHTLVHAQGFVLQLDDDRRLDVATADGVPVPHHPKRFEQSAAGIDPHERLGAATLRAVGSQPRLDLGYAVSVLMRQAA